MELSTGSQILLGWVTSVMNKKYFTDTNTSLYLFPILLYHVNRYFSIKSAFF